MKKFFKGIFTLFGIIAAAFGTLALLDKLSSRNRIEGDYLECENGSEEE